MADLSDLQAAQTVKIAGANVSGDETFFLNIDSSGRPTVISQNYTASGSAINFGQGVMSASLPVVIASNQTALPISNFPTTADTNYGTVGASTIRTASQIGNATGAALFGAGTTTAQVLRVVLPTDQTAIPATQSGTWTVQPGNTQNTTAWLTQDAADGSVAPGTAATKSMLVGGQFNTVLPTLTNTQQSAIQLDSSGRLIIAPLTNASIIKAQLQDNAGIAITLGQKVMASSVPVVISSDQSTIPVSAASLPLPSGAATEVTLAKLTLAQASATSGQSGPLAQGAVTTAAPTYTTGQTDPLSLTTAGALRVDGSAVTQPVSGTITANQGGIWTVQPGNTANTTPWLVTDSSDGSVAPGTAAAKSSLAGLIFNTALPTLTNGQQAAVQGDSSGRLIIAPLANTSIVKAQLQDNAGTAITLGQKAMANSLPVVIASDQSTIPVIQTDISPATQNITALDSGTSSLVGANGQVFYFGSPTANSAATFALSSIGNVTIQGSLIGSGGTMVVEVSEDGGTFWLRPNVYQIATQSFSNGFTSPFVVVVNVGGMTHVRVRSTVSWTGTGTINVKETVNIQTTVVTDSNLPVGAATAAAQATQLTSLQILDDLPAAQNGALVKGVAVMGQLDDTSTTVATEDNLSAVRITAQRGVHANLRNVAGTEIGTSGAPVRTDPTGTTTQPTSDVINGAATQATKSISTTPLQLNVSGSGNVANRKQLIVQAQGTGLSYGYTVGSQPFSLPNGTTLVLPFGANITLWVVRNTAATVPVIVAELT